MAVTQEDARRLLQEAGVSITGPLPLEEGHPALTHPNRVDLCRMLMAAILDMTKEPLQLSWHLRLDDFSFVDDEGYAGGHLDVFMERLANRLGLVSIASGADIVALETFGDLVLYAETYFVELYRNPTKEEILAFLYRRFRPNREIGIL